MKKYLVLILCICLLTPCFAFASVDFASMKDEEILECKDALYAEIIDRKLLKSASIPVGKYIVGIDIPAGDYTFYLDDKNASKYGTPIAVYINEAESEKTLGKKTFDQYVYPDQIVGKITLKDGNVFSVGCKIKMEQYSGILFQ